MSDNWSLIVDILSLLILLVEIMCPYTLASADIHKFDMFHRAVWHSVCSNLLECLNTCCVDTAVEWL